MKLRKEKIIMLPVEENKLIEPPFISTRVDRYGDLTGGISYQVFPKDGRDRPQYLYIVTDDEIKEKDKYLAKHNIEGEILSDKLIISIASKNFILNHYIKGLDIWRKIIATNNKSLNLPGLPQSFIENYCKVGGIDEVLVEYELSHCKYCTNLNDSRCNIKNNCNSLEYYNRLKVDSHNTIQIHFAKDSWNREEVDNLCRDAMFTGELLGRNPLKPTPFGKGFDEISKNWIKEKLI